MYQYDKQVKSSQDQDKRFDEKTEKQIIKGKNKIQEIDIKQTNKNVKESK